MSDKIVLSLNDIVGAVAYNAYRMSPNHKPRKIEIVMNKCLEYSKTNLEQPFKNDKTWWSKGIDPKDVYEFVHDMLFSIPEFVEWNLSEIEIENGISVDDDNRPKFAFTSAYDIRDDDYWKSDFIDLDAFVNNVCRVIDVMLRE